jgi:hypothetical protein
VLDDQDKLAITNERGDAAFYFPGEKGITSVELNISKPQYQAAAVEISVAAQERNHREIVLATS